MEELLESLTLPFLAVMCVVGTIVLVRLDTLSRRKGVEEEDLTEPAEDTPRRPSRR